MASENPALDQSALDDGKLHLSGVGDVSSDQLQRLLDRLEAKAGSVMDSMAQTLQSHYPGFRGTFENVSDVQSTIASLDTTLNDLVAQMASPTSALGVEASASHREAKIEAKLATVRGVIKTLEQLNAIKKLFAQLDSDLSSGRSSQYIRCSQLLTKLKQELESLKENTGAIDSSIIRAINLQYMRKTAKLRAKLQTVFIQLYEVPKANTISVKGGREDDDELADPSVESDWKASETVTMHHLLYAFQTLGVLDEKLSNGIAAGVVSQIILPLIETTLSLVSNGEMDTNQYPVVQISESNGSNSAVTLSLDCPKQTPESTVELKQPTNVISANIIQHIFDQVSSTFHFVFRDVLAQDNQLFERIAPFLWAPTDPELHGGVACSLLALIRQAIPTTGSSLVEQCYQIQRAAEEFENELVQLGFLGDFNDTQVLERFSRLLLLSASSKDRQQEERATNPQSDHSDKFFTQSPSATSMQFRKCGKVLSPYVRNIEEHWARERQATILGDVRQCISESYVRTTSAREAVKRTPMFESMENNLLEWQPRSKTREANRFVLSDEMKVSVAAKRCMELVHEAFEGAVNAENPGASSLLYHCGRDIFVMFRALVTSAHKTELSEQPAAAMLFHNDCMFLVHHLVTLAHYYRPKFDASLRPNIITVDMVPQLRKAGLDCFQGQVKLQLDGLITMFRSGPPLSHIAAEYTAVEETMNRSMGLFTRTTNAWSLVLPREELCAAVAALSEGFVNEVISAFRNLQVIHNEDMQHLHFLLNVVSVNLFHVRIEQGSTSDANSTTAKSTVPIGHMVKNSTQIEQMAAVLEPQVTPVIFAQMKDSNSLVNIEPVILNLLQNAVQERADFRA